MTPCSGLCLSDLEMGEYFAGVECGGGTGA